MPRPSITATADGDAAGVGPRHVFLIRHGERPTGPAAGIAEDGSRNEHSLTPRGWQRAGALAVLFAPAGSPVRPGLERPSRLIAPDYGVQDAAVHRTVQTLTPLARRLGLPVESHAPKGSEAALVTGHVLAAHDHVVLLCWDHEHIPDVVAALTAAVEVVPAPQLPASGWPGERFDVVLAFSRLAGAAQPRYAFTEIAQLVLDGDTDAGLSSTVG